MTHARVRAHFVTAVSVCILCLSNLAVGAFIPLTGDPVALSSLDGNHLVVDDKTFSDFEVFSFASGGALVPDESGIFVQGGQDSDTGHYGLRFITSIIAGSGQFAGVNFSFKVTVGEDLDLYIEDAYLELELVSASGTGAAGINERVETTGGELLALQGVSKQQSDGDAFLADHEYFRPVKEIVVLKGISVSGGVAGSAQINQFLQYYSQIPEPASFAMLALGGVVVLLRRRRSAGR